MALLAAAGVAAGLGACGSVGQGDDADVVVTTNVLGDVVRALVGDDATVEVVMPPAANPHEFAPSPRQVAAMREAEVLVTNGRRFEEGLLDTIEAAEADGAVVVTATDALPDDHDGDHGTNEADEDQGDHGTDENHHEDDGHDHGASDEADHDDGHDHGGDGHVHDHHADAHFFADPVLMATVVEHLAAELRAHVPALATDAFDARVAAYLAELDALHHEVVEILAPIPAERRVLVTNHDVLGFFADRYDLQVLGVVVPGGSTLAEPSAAALSALASAVEAAGVPAVFVDASASSRLADALAAEGRGVAVVELHTESLGEAGSGADTYLGMVRTNAERIAAALSGEPPAG